MVCHRYGNNISAAKAGDRVLGCIRPVGCAKRLGSAWFDSAWLGTARLGSARLSAARAPKMGRSRRGPNPSVPSTAMFFNKKRLRKKNFEKYASGRYRSFGDPKWDGPGGGPIRPYPRPPCFFNKKRLRKKTSKNTLQGGTAVSGCQNGTVPAQGEIHLAYSLFANFIENDF